MIVLGDGDRIVSLTDTHTDAVRGVASVLVGGYVSNSLDALTKVLGELDTAAPGDRETSDVSAVVVTRATPPR